ncbi:MAG TPA: SAM-dependent methyltransferase, partial [Acidimicrobiales bacterium]|nr:SAM-dependent methyltransferase [Acidimicrobiales bacterium]
ATRVYAVDVGHAQLHERLREDPRVTVLERTDVRALRLDLLEGRPVDAASVDLSFISLTSVLPVLLGGLVVGGGPVVLLVKPQFEAGRPAASRGRGVIRDPDVHRRCLARVADAVVAAGGAVEAAMPSPLRGRSGNVEFLVHATASPGDGRVGGRSDGRGGEDLERLLDEVVAEAHDARQDGPPWR